MNDLPGWHNVRPDPQDAESCDENDLYCESHDWEYRWPDSCPVCRRETRDKIARMATDDVITFLLRNKELPNG